MKPTRIIHRTTLALSATFILGALGAPATIAATPASEARATAAVTDSQRATNGSTIATNVADPEQGQTYLLTVDPESNPHVVSVTLQERKPGAKKWKTLDEVPTKRKSTHVFSRTASGFGDRLYRARIEYKNGTRVVTAPVTVTMFGWVRTEFFDTVSDSDYTYDGRFTAGQKDRIGWYAAGEPANWMTVYNTNVCRAFQGTPMQQDEAEVGSQSTFKFSPGAGKDAFATRVVTRSTAKQPLRIDFDTTRFRVDVGNDFDVKKGSDGPDALPAIANSKFLCSVNDDATIGGAL